MGCENTLDKLPVYYRNTHDRNKPSAFIHGMQVFALLEKAGVLRENPRRHGQNTERSKVGIKPSAFLLNREIKNNTFTLFSGKNNIYINFILFSCKVEIIVQS